MIIKINKYFVIYIDENKTLSYLLDDNSFKSFFWLRIFVYIYSCFQGCLPLLLSNKIVFIAFFPVHC